MCIPGGESGQLKREQAMCKLGYARSTYPPDLESHFRFLTKGVT